jgi:hypothetical protein
MCNRLALLSFFIALEISNFSSVSHGCRRYQTGILFFSLLLISFSAQHQSIGNKRNKNNFSPTTSNIEAQLLFKLVHTDSYIVGLEVYYLAKKGPFRSRIWNLSNNCDYNCKKSIVTTIVLTIARA